MEVYRRQFLKISARAAGRVVATEMEGWGVDTVALKKEALNIPIKTWKQVPSVGCEQIVMINDAGKIIDIQGNPDSPVSFGTLCPKGAATYQLVVKDLRSTKVKYRAPGGDHWEDKPLDWAMNRIAELVKKTRYDNFNEFQDAADVTGKTSSKRIMNTYPIASLGGATIDNE
jgi:formate dehydrogenase major subunit